MVPLTCSDVLVSLSELPSSPVGAEQPQHRAAGGFERDAVEGGDGTELLVQPISHDRGLNATAVHLPEPVLVLGAVELHGAAYFLLGLLARTNTDQNPSATTWLSTISTSVNPAPSSAAR